MKSQQVCILDIDVQGVRQVKESGLEGVRYVFIKPPSLEVLEERLRSRGTETEEAIEKVTYAVHKYFGFFDTFVIQYLETHRQNF